MSNTAPLPLPPDEQTNDSKPKLEVVVDNRNLPHAEVNRADVEVNRALAPLYLLVILVLFFILSPLLPIGIREYVSVLR
jgi:hypothetical protein